MGYAITDLVKAIYRSGQGNFKLAQYLGCEMDTIGCCQVYSEKVKS